MAHGLIGFRGSACLWFVLRHAPDPSPPGHSAAPGPRTRSHRAVPSPPIHERRRPRAPADEFAVDAHRAAVPVGRRRIAGAGGVPVVDYVHAGEAALGDLADGLSPAHQRTVVANAARAKAPGRHVHEHACGRIGTPVPQQPLHANGPHRSRRRRLAVPVAVVPCRAGSGCCDQAQRCQHGCESEGRDAPVA